MYNYLKNDYVDISVLGSVWMHGKGVIKSDDLRTMANEGQGERKK